jgi:hypothetical protein
MQTSGASRREIVKPRLELVLLFEKFEVGVCVRSACSTKRTRNART